VEELGRRMERPRKGRKGKGKGRERGGVKFRGSLHYWL